MEEERVQLKGATVTTPAWSSSHLQTLLQGWQVAAPCRAAPCLLPPRFLGTLLLGSFSLFFPELLIPASLCVGKSSSGGKTLKSMARARPGAGAGVGASTQGFCAALGGQWGHSSSPWSRGKLQECQGTGNCASLRCHQHPQPGVLGSPALGRRERAGGGRHRAASASPAGADRHPAPARGFL